MADYQVTIKTSNVQNAGTKAVYFVLIGDQGKTKVQHPSKSCEAGKDTPHNFSDDVDVGTLRYVVIGHNGSGDQPGWHLDHVEVVKDGQTATFHYNDWLSKDVKPYSTFAVLTPGDPR